MRVVTLIAALALGQASRGGARAATDSELVEARKLFEKGIVQEEAGDWAGALESFRKVALVRANHVVRFHVGLCLEMTGRLVTARDEFVVARSLGEKEATADAKQDRKSTRLNSSHRL